jgi:uncharacterized repeat protein (TIGR02543 family)
MQSSTPNIINLIFEAGRGDCSVRTQEATTGERFGTLPRAQRAGYDFEGWFTAEGTQVSAGDIVTAEDSLVLYARYAKKKGAAAKKKKSSYRTQKRVLFTLLGVIAVLIAAYFVVNYIVSIIPYTDYDGAVYKAKKVGGVYSIYDADGYELEVNREGYYLTKLGTQLELNPDTGVIKEYAIVYTEGMEEPGANKRILMFAQIRQANVVSIQVNNTSGKSFRIYTKDITADKKEIVVEGYEDDKYLVSYNPELYAYLCVAAGYPLTVNKLPNDRVAELGYDEYGLVEETRTDKDGNEYTYRPTTYTIVGAKKNADGTWMKDAEGKVVTVEHTVIVGDPIVGGGGYYCKLAGEENKSVYIMNNDNYDKALLQPIESLITPLITYPASMNTCFNVENFILAACVGGDKYDLDIEVAFDYIDLTMRSSTMYSAEPYRTGSGYRYQYGGYRLNSDVLSTILQALYQPTILRVCELGVHKNEDVLAQYGLDQPYKRLSYDLQLDADNDAKFDGVATNELWISKKTENGTYYVYSELCDVVAEVDQTSFYFMEFDRLDWVNPFVVWHNLAYLRDMEVISPSYSSSMVFDNSKSSQAENINSTNLTFTINGKVPDYVVYKTAYATGKVTAETPVYNLRQFYKTLLSLTVGGDVQVGEHFTLTDEQMEAFRAMDDSQCQLVIKMNFEDYAKLTNPSYYKENNKSTLVFRFYRYSEGRSYMTINGEGEFFVDASFVEKMLADAKRLEDGILIDSNAKK